MPSAADATIDANPPESGGRGAPVDPETLGTTGDFADWLSPMVVKELRQSLRTKVFVGVFIIAQVLMIFATFVSVASGGATGINTDTGPFLMAILGTVLTILLPLRGLQAVAGEAGDDTLELLVLTRLHSFRILVGKWCSIVAQALLCVVAVLPYFLLRYFLGGVEILDDLKAIAFMLLLCVGLSACTVGISCMVGRKARKFLWIGAAILAVVVFNAIILEPLSYSSSSMFELPSDIDNLGGWIGSIIVVGIASYYFLRMGATRIAPDAENHSTQKRLLGFVVMIILYALSLTDVITDDEVWLILGLLVAVTICVDALNERVCDVRSIYVPFARKRGLGWTAYFLAPGWHTATLFSFVVSTLSVAAFWANDSMDWDDTIILILLGASMFFGAAIIRLFFRNHKETLFLSIVTHAACIGIVFAIEAASIWDIIEEYLVGTIIPHVALGVHEGLRYYNSWRGYNGFIHGPMHWLIPCQVMFLSILILLSRGRPHFASLREHLESIRETLKNEAAEEDDHDTYIEPDEPEILTNSDANAG